MDPHPLIYKYQAQKPLMYDEKFENYTLILQSLFSSIMFSLKILLDLNIGGSLAKHVLATL